MPDVYLGSCLGVDMFARRVDPPRDKRRDDRERELPGSHYYVWFGGTTRFDPTAWRGPWPSEAAMVQDARDLFHKAAIAANMPHNRPP